MQFYVYNIYQSSTYSLLWAVSTSQKQFTGLFFLVYLRGRSNL